MGQVVSTVKVRQLAGIKLLVVQMIRNGVPAGCTVAADATRQAGVGDDVFIMDSKEAGMLFRNGMMPVDASICGFIDQYNESIQAEGN